VTQTRSEADAASPERPTRRPLSDAVDALAAPFADPGLRRPVIVGFVGAIVTVVFGAVTRPAGSLTLLYPLSGRSLPPAENIVTVLIAMCGVGMMLAAWIAVFREVRRRFHADDAVRTRSAVAVWVLWSLPFVFGPALFSRDIFSYSGQGEMVSRGYDPYTLGVRVLGQGNAYLNLVDPIWRGTPCPYGPFWLWLSSTVASVTGHQPLVTVLLFRLIAIASIAVSVWCLIRLSRHYGGDTATVLVLAVCNPLTIFHAISGAHNEALMMALLLLGMVLAVEGYLVPGVVACALAASIKIPAFAAVVFLGWAAAGPMASLARRVWSTIWVSAVGLVVVAVTSVVSGLGFGWISAIQGAGGSRSLLAPARAFGIAARDLSGWLGVPLWDADVKQVTTLLGLGLAAALSAAVLVRTKDRVPFVSLGLALLLVSLLGPALYPWYVLPAFAIMSLTLRESRMWLIIVLSVVGCLVILPSGAGVLHRIGGAGPWVIPVLVVAGGIIWYRRSRLGGGTGPGAAASTGVVEVG
jgi:hypothetical protein